MSTKMDVPSHVQTALEQGGVEHVSFWYVDEGGSGSKNMSDETKEYLEDWFIQHGSFGLLKWVEGLFVYRETEALARMAEIATPSEAFNWIEDRVAECGYSLGTYQRDRILPFIKAVAMRDKDYAVAVVGALLSYLDDIVSGAVIEALGSALKQPVTDEQVVDALNQVMLSEEDEESRPG